MNWRVLIATNKPLRGLPDTFSLGNLKQLANFKEVPIQETNTGKHIGRAYSPKLITDSGIHTLTVIAELFDKRVPEPIHYSVGYQVHQRAFSVEKDDYVPVDIQLRSVLAGSRNYHD